ncbi:MAG: CRTAC1 family protein, partial [Bryobacteraceae bacterium]|nr:CRTAC1 family protein [Bryobacteraceae bacterium]
DLDGWLDILAVNGHLDEEINRVQPKVTYKEPPLVFRNLGKRKFANVTPDLGADFNRPIVGRGAIYGDIDHDGDLDVLFTSNHGPAFLYRNDGGNRNQWLQVRTVGSKSNRDGIGAVVRVESASGRQSQMVRSGSSYCSQSDLALTFGLGKDTKVTSLEIDWPSGAKQQIRNLDAGEMLTIDESRGIVNRAKPAQTK